MRRYKAGDEIDSYCTKCRMDLLHKIVAVVSEKPVKVECRTCYGVHNYRLPRGVKNPGDVPIESEASAPRVRTAERTPRAAAPVAMTEPLTPPPGVMVHPYRITEKFAPETWLQHKVFGIGRVVREVGPGKIEVRFEDENRVLVHEKVD